MNRPHDNDQPIDKTIILFLSGLLFLITPMMQWWVGEKSPWYTLYLIWGLLIFFIWRIQRVKKVK